MEKSLFVKWAAYFTSIAKGFVELVNGSKTPQTYLHKEMLTQELSTDLEWKSLNVDGSIVSADVVAMDSALPLKKRDSISTASGTIPKLGMKLALSEKVMSDIDILTNRNAETKVLVQKMFSDSIKATVGIYEKLEFMFLQGLSTGVTAIDDDVNVGTGIRVEYGYLPANSFGASVPWSDADAKPLDDIKRVIKAAKTKGDTMTTLMMDDTTFEALAKNAQMRESFAFTLGYVGSQVPVPNFDQVNSVMKSNFKLNIIIVDRTVVTERDGKRTIHRPWMESRVVFLTNTKVGKLVYGTLAEDTRRSPDVMYEKLDNFILLKKWHEKEPFAEFTSSQALVIPVINNASSIYTLDSEEASTDDQTEGDANFAYNGTDYTKVSVVSAIKLAKPSSKLTVASKDETIQKSVNELSGDQIVIFEDNIIAAV